MGSNTMQERVVKLRCVCRHGRRGHKPWDKLIGGPLGSVLWVNHEEHVWETGAKIGSISVVMPGGLGCVDIHTFRAIQLHHGLSWDVRQAWKTAISKNVNLWKVAIPLLSTDEFHRMNREFWVQQHHCSMSGAVFMVL